MQDKILKLKMDLQNVLGKKEIIVDNINLEKKGNYNFLTITLDKIGGIDLDMIVEATNIIDPIVDNADITDDSFIMDVVSKERG